MNTFYFYFYWHAFIDPAIIYYYVRVWVVIQFSNSVWFLGGRESVQVFCSFKSMLFTVWDPIIKRGGFWILFTGLTPPCIWACHQPWSGFPRLMPWSFCVHWFEVRSDCSFCWYWWIELMTILYITKYFRRLTK